MILGPMICVAAALLSQLGASPSREAPSAQGEEDHSVKEIDLIEWQLGMDLVVVNQNQLNLPYFLAGKYWGGLRVIHVTEPLAKAAGIRPGDTIVAMDEAAVTNARTALQALHRAQQSLERTKLTILRGNNPVSVELLLAPSADNKSERGAVPDTQVVSTQDRSLAERARDYREMRQLMIAELTRVEDLQRVLPGKDPRQAEAAQRQRLEAVTDQMAQLADDREKRLAEVQGRLAEAMAANKSLDPRERIGTIDAIVRQREVLEKQLENVVKQIESYQQQSLRLEKTAAELEMLQQRVRVLQKALERSIRAIRLAQAEPTQK